MVPRAPTRLTCNSPNASPDNTKLTLNGNQVGKCNKHQASKMKKMEKAGSISLPCETRKSTAATVGNFYILSRPTVSYADAKTTLSRSLQFTTPNILVHTNPTVGMSEGFRYQKYCWELQGSYQAQRGTLKS